MHTKKNSELVYKFLKQIKCNIFYLFCDFYQNMVYYLVAPDVKMSFLLTYACYYIINNPSFSSKNKMNKPCKIWNSW